MKALPKNYEGKKVEEGFLMEDNASGYFYINVKGC